MTVQAQSTVDSAILQKGEAFSTLINKQQPGMQNQQRPVQNFSNSTDTPSWRDFYDNKGGWGDRKK